MDVDDLKKIYGVFEDQDLVPKVKRSKSAVSLWRKNGIPPKIILAAEQKLRADAAQSRRISNANNHEPIQMSDILGKTISIPIISWAQAGTEGFFEDSYFVGGGIGSLTWFDDLRDASAYVLQVRGDSMYDRYCEGEYIVVSPAAGVKTGDYAVVKLRDGQVMVKKVKARNGEFVLSSSNPKYDDLFVKADDIVFVHKIVGSRPGY